MERPKKVRDWNNGYIRARRAMQNGYGAMPAGTIYFVESAEITAHLKSDACACCGFQQRITIKGKDKFADFDWLGYEHPETQTPALSTS